MRVRTGWSGAGWATGFFPGIIYYLGTSGLAVNPDKYGARDAYRCLHFNDRVFRCRAISLGRCASLTGEQEED